MTTNKRTYKQTYCLDCGKKLGAGAFWVKEYERCAKCANQYYYKRNIRGKGINWTKAEDQILEQEYGTMPNKELAKKLNRSKNSIEVRAHYRKLTTKLVAVKKYCIDCGVILSRASVSRGSIVRCFKCAMKLRAKENHHNWKGGVSKLDSIVHCLLKPVWINPILERDSFTCQLCGKHGGDMEIHHLRLYVEIRDLILKQYSDLDMQDFDNRKALALKIVEEHVLSDGITLCISCHHDVHKSHGVNCLGTPQNEDNQQPSQGSNSLEGSTTNLRLLPSYVGESNEDTSALALKISIGA